MVSIVLVGIYYKTYDHAPCWRWYCSSYVSGSGGLTSTGVALVLLLGLPSQDLGVGLVPDGTDLVLLVVASGQGGHVASSCKEQHGQASDVLHLGCVCGKG